MSGIDIWNAFLFFLGGIGAVPLAWVTFRERKPFEALLYLGMGILFLAFVQVTISEAFGSRKTVGLQTEVQHPSSTPPPTLAPSHDARALMLAIRNEESRGYYGARGGDGERGAYQFTPSTWREWASVHLSDPDAPLTPENQDLVALKQIEHWLRAGRTPAEIASLWNSGSPDPTGRVGISRGGVPYNTPRYVGRVVDRYRDLAGGTP